VLEGDFDPFAEDRGFGEGLGADEGEERTDVGKLILNGCTRETPSRVGVEAVASTVEGCGWAADGVC